MSSDASGPQLSKSHDGTHEPTEDYSSGNKLNLARAMAFVLIENAANSLALFYFL